VTRLVVDPNVLVSAVITPGTPADLMLLLEATTDIDVVLCPHLLAELEGVLRRDRFRRYVSIEDVDRHVNAVANLGTMAPDPHTVDPTTCRDPNDAYLITLARAGAADAIVSGDLDLTSLVDLHPPVLTPAEAFERFGTSLSTSIALSSHEPPARLLDTARPSPSSSPQLRSPTRSARHRIPDIEKSSALTFPSLGR
jgi:putative PIN family toxin of toxin-antitoxin system